MPFVGDVKEMDKKITETKINEFKKLKNKLKLTIECVDNTTLIFEIPNDFPIEKIINSSSDWVEINNTYINLKNIEYFKIEEGEEK